MKIDHSPKRRQNRLTSSSTIIHGAHECGRIKRAMKKAWALLLNGDHKALAIEIADKIPDAILRYNNFYILHCGNLVPTWLTRHLPKGYRLCLAPFSYVLLDRIKKELPQDLSTIYYRLRHRENNTCIIHIEKEEKIVASCFVLVDHVVPSPSGYDLNMGRKVVTCYGLYMAPSQRMRGLHLHIFRTAFRLSAEVGTPGLYGEIHYRNNNSLLSHYRMGFRIYKNIKYVKLFNWYHFFEGPPIDPLTAVIKRAG